MTALPSHRCKQRARRAKHCPISRGWWLTTDRQSAWTAVVHCRPRSVWRHYECRQDWQVDASTHGTVAYLLHVLPYVGLVRMFTRHCRSVISRWLVTTVTLLVAVRHQFMWPVVGVCCLCSGQQYSPPSLHCSRHSLLLPLPRIPFTAVDGCSEWNAGRRRTGASQRRRQSVALAGFGDRFLGNETGHRFEKRVPVTVLQP